MITPNATSVTATAALAALALLSSACSSPGPGRSGTTALAAPRAAGSTAPEVLTRQAPAAAPAAALEAARGPEQGQPLDLAAALAAALEAHPRLRAADRERVALGFDREAAGQKPSPSLGVDLEDFGGSGSVRGLEGAQTTLWIGAPLERGGKRAARAGLVDAELDLAGLERELLVLDLSAELARAYWDTLEAQELLALAEEDEHSAAWALDAVAERVAGGRLAPLAEQRAALALTEARLTRSGAERALAQARRGLAATWGGRPDFGPLTGAPDGGLGSTSAPPSLEELEPTLTSGPRLGLAEARRERGAAELRLAESAGAADWQLTFGLRRYEATDEAAAVVGLEVPLFTGRRARSAQSAARERVERAALDHLATARELRAELARTLAELEVQHREATSLELLLIPEATAVAVAVEAAFVEGRADLTDLLAARTSLRTARARLVAAQAAYRRASTDLQRLLGAPFTSPTDA